ncbi:MAG: peptide-methionine (S)-S-oxide reductase MsrA [Actinomycetota bacterium]|jgi:peptide-methionine (S)-S-oxide reductase
MFGRKDPEMISPEKALPGRTDQTMPVPEQHFVKATPLVGPFPEQMKTLVVGMGCFWGAERIFWQTPGVYSTSVGYAGGYTPNPTYEEVCSGLTGHTEVLMAVYDSWNMSVMDLLRVFWESHNPTQGMRQGNDMGTQYRSAIYYADEDQRIAAEESRDAYQELLTNAGFGEITTEIAPLTEYFYAEPYHQQYLGKNPNGYCGIGGTGVSCSIGML